MVHELKCNNRFWPDYKSGRKNNSMRIDDRNYAVGDTVILKLWDEDRFILNEVVVRKIMHILHDFDFKPLPKGYCILSFENV